VLLKTKRLNQFLVGYHYIIAWIYRLITKGVSTDSDLGQIGSNWNTNLV